MFIVYAVYVRKHVDDLIGPAIFTADGSEDICRHRLRRSSYKTAEERHIREGEGPRRGAETVQEVCEAGKMHVCASVCVRMYVHQCVHACMCLSVVTCCRLCVPSSLQGI